MLNTWIICWYGTGILCCQCLCTSFQEIFSKGTQQGCSRGCKYIHVPSSVNLRKVHGAYTYVLFAVCSIEDLGPFESPIVLTQLFCLQSAALKTSDHRRATPVGTRLEEQQKHLNLPILPTTTIGSFPQTPELRRVRREVKSKKYVQICHMILFFRPPWSLFDCCADISFSPKLVSEIRASDFFWAIFTEICSFFLFLQDLSGRVWKGNQGRNWQCCEAPRGTWHWCPCTWRTWGRLLYLASCT